MSGEQEGSELSAISIQQGTIETAETRMLRYERALRAIRGCGIANDTDFGDYVQALCEDVLAGGEPECWKCGAAVHDGPCVAEAES